MAVQILPNTGMGKNLGDALGSGIQQALGMLAQQKLQNMLRTQGAPGLEGLGFSPEQAQNVSLLDPMVQREVVKQRVQAPQQQAFAQALSGILGEQQPAESLAGLASEEQQMLPQVATSETKFSPQMPTNLTAQQATQLAQVGLKKQAMGQRERLAGQKMTEQREMAYKKDIDEAVKQRAKLDKQINSLNNIKKYSASGKLNHPATVKLLQKTGMDWLLSPESQAFMSESKSFYDSFKDLFGARPLGVEFEEFKKMLPSLMQSEEGRQLIYDNFDRLYQAKKARADAVIDAFKENKNLSPVDMVLRIEDIAQEKINALKKKDLNQASEEESSAIAKEEPSPIEAFPQKEKASFAEKAKGLLGTAAAAPFKLAELPLHGMEYLSSKGIIPQPTDRENLYNASNIKEAFGGATPENVFEKALDYTAGNWPMLFLGGGSMAGKLGADLAGSLGLAVSEKLTDNPWLQIGAGILGSAGFGKLASMIKKDPSKIGDYINKTYEAEKELGSKIKVDSDPIRKPIEDLYSDVEKKFTSPRFSQAQKSRTLENIKVAENLATKPNLTAADVFDIKKNLNQLWSGGKSVENQFNKRLQKIFLNRLDDIASSNPKWGETWKHADNLYKIKNWQTGLQRWMNSESGMFGKVVKNPIAQGAVAVLGGILPGTRTIAASGAALYGGAKAAEKATKAVKFLNELGKTDSGKKLLWELTTASAKDNAKNIASTLNKLNKKADKFTHNQ